MAFNGRKYLRGIMLTIGSRMTQHKLVNLSEEIARIQLEYLLKDENIIHFEEVSTAGTPAFDFGMTNEEYFKGTAEAANISLETKIE